MEMNRPIIYPSFGWLFFSLKKSNFPTKLEVPSYALITSIHFLNQSEGRRIFPISPTNKWLWRSSVIIESSEKKIPFIFKSLSRTSLSKKQLKLMISIDYVFIYKRM